MKKQTAVAAVKGKKLFRFRVRGSWVNKGVVRSDYGEKWCEAVYHEPGGFPPTLA